jgi:hypothetical protein
MAGFISIALTVVVVVPVVVVVVVTVVPLLFYSMKPLNLISFLRLVSHPYLKK